jgi:hypothetical protein
LGTGINLEEEIEKAFIAGFEFCASEVEAPGWNEYMLIFPDKSELDKATIDYINGNRESS